jgi:hypothetical protein
LFIFACRNIIGLNHAQENIISYYFLYMFDC